MNPVINSQREFKHASIVYFIFNILKDTLLKKNKYTRITRWSLIHAEPFIFQTTFRDRGGYRASSTKTRNFVLNSGKIWELYSFLTCKSNSDRNIIMEKKSG